MGDDAKGGWCGGHRRDGALGHLLDPERLCDVRPHESYLSCIDGGRGRSVPFHGVDEHAVRREGCVGIGRVE